MSFVALNEVWRVSSPGLLRACSARRSSPWRSRSALPRELDNTAQVLSRTQSGRRTTSSSSCHPSDHERLASYGTTLEDGTWPGGRGPCQPQHYSFTGRARVRLPSRPRICPPAGSGSGAGRESGKPSGRTRTAPARTLPARPEGSRPAGSDPGRPCSASPDRTRTGSAPSPRPSRGAPLPGSRSTATVTCRPAGRPPRPRHRGGPADHRSRRHPAARRDPGRFSRPARSPSPCTTWAPRTARASTASARLRARSTTAARSCSAIRCSSSVVPGESVVSELTVTIIKLAFLCLLWLFIMSAVSVMRADLFGTRVGRQRRRHEQRAPAQAGQGRGHRSAGAVNPPWCSWSRAVHRAGAPLGRRRS